MKLYTRTEEGSKQLKIVIAQIAATLLSGDEGAYAPSGSQIELAVMAAAHIFLEADQIVEVSETAIAAGGAR